VSQAPVPFPFPGTRLLPPGALQRIGGDDVASVPRVITCRTTTRSVARFW
jgi:hypothetical protein